MKTETVELGTGSPKERLDAFHKLFHVLFDDPEEAFLAASLMSIHAGAALKPDRMKDLLMNEGGLSEAIDKKFGKPDLTERQIGSIYAELRTQYNQYGTTGQIRRSASGPDYNSERLNLLRARPMVDREHQVRCSVVGQRLRRR